MSALLALYGGDRRQLVCANLLKKQGYRVTLRATSDGILPTDTPLSDCAAAIFPMPCGRDSFLHAPLWGEPLSFDALLQELPATCPLFVGMPNDHFLRAAASRPVHDYSDHEPLAVSGAVATAEGALAIAMACLPCTLWQTKVAILGFGRIAKILAHRLRGMGAEITVYARKESDRAWATAYGYRSFSTSDFSALAEHRIIFNTAPACLLSAQEIAPLSKNTLYVELASVSGIEIDAAREHGVRVESAPGLPGKQSPETAGHALFHTLCAFLTREGILP